MPTKLRIAIPVFGDYSRSIAQSAASQFPENEIVVSKMLGAENISVLVLAVDAGAPEAIGFAKALVQTSANVVTIVASDASEGIVRTLLRETGMAPARILGIGTVPLTERFRELIAMRCRVAPGEVHAHIAGDSGGVLAPLWSTAAVAAVPLHHWAVAGHGKLSVRDRIEIFQAAKEPFDQAARVAATMQVIDAVVNDRNRILSVCALLTEYNGISDICLSVPHIVNRTGAEVAVNIPLNPAEEAGLRQAAEAIISAN